jgi:hypothetical protein
VSGTDTMTTYYYKATTDAVTVMVLCGMFANTTYVAP